LFITSPPFPQLFQLKEALRSKYGFENVTPAQIKLASCDGPLADNDNPEGADLEEDDLIDVTIKVRLIDQTIPFLDFLS
jgi:hypothetical protein